MLRKETGAGCSAQLSRGLQAGHPECSRRDDWQVSYTTVRIWFSSSVMVTSGFLYKNGLYLWHFVIIFLINKSILWTCWNISDNHSFIIHFVVRIPRIIPQSYYFVNGPAERWRFFSIQFVSFIRYSQVLKFYRQLMISTENCKAQMEKQIWPSPV